MESSLKRVVRAQLAKWDPEERRRKAEAEREAGNMARYFRQARSATVLHDVVFAATMYGDAAPLYREASRRAEEAAQWRAAESDAIPLSFLHARHDWCAGRTGRAKRILEGYLRWFAEETGQPPEDKLLLDSQRGPVLRLLRFWGQNELAARYEATVERDCRQEEEEQRPTGEADPGRTKILRIFPLGRRIEFVYIRGAYDECVEMADWMQEGYALYRERKYKVSGWQMGGAQTDYERAMGLRSLALVRAGNADPENELPKGLKHLERAMGRFIKELDWDFSFYLRLHAARAFEAFGVPHENQEEMREHFPHLLADAEKF